MAAEKIDANKHLVIACSGCGGSGSVSNVALHHARELARFMRVTLISDSLPEHPISGVNFVKVAPPRFFFLRRFGHVPTEYAFVRAVRLSFFELHQRQTVDVVICHSHALAALAAYPFRRKYGVPFAMVTHGDIFYRPKGTYDPRLTWFYKTVTPSAYQHADLILALSPFMAECARQGGAFPERIKVAPNGIDPDEIGIDLHISRLARVEKKADILKIMFVGRLSVEKGVDTLIHACRRLQENAVPFHLNIIGDGPLNNALHFLVGKLGLSQKVIFLGKVPRNKLGAYYSSADVVCVPSVSEALATVILEALVSECTVVATDTGGNPFMLSHEQNGLITPVGDVEALANALERLYRNPDFLRGLKENARPTVLKRFLWKNVAQTIYESLIGLRAVQ
jgi:glycosyltransferase involved in cell wall biosynthesis